MIVATGTATTTEESPTPTVERTSRRKDLSPDEISQIAAMSKPSDLDPADAKTKLMHVHPANCKIDIQKKCFEYKCSHL